MTKYTLKVRVRRQSMEQLDLIKITPDGKRAQKQDAKVRPIKAQDDDFFELLSRSQSKRMDDQRCSIKINKNPTGPTNASSAAAAGTAGTGATRKPLQQHNSIQTNSGFPANDTSSTNGANCLPGLKATAAGATNAASTKSSSSASGAHHPPLSRSATTTEQVDDAFLDMLMRCQSSRLEEQRSELPRPNVLIDAEAQNRNRPSGSGNSAGRGAGTTVPDEDFFSLIMKVQSGRMEDQRAAIPMTRRDASNSSNNTNNQSNK